MLIHRRVSVVTPDADRAQKERASPASQSATSKNWQRLAIIFALIGAWAAVHLSAPAYLPLQLASWLTFIALFITPGYLLGDMVARALAIDWLERLALAFPLGVAIMAIPGMVALLQHRTLTELGAWWSIFTALVVVAWLLHALWRQGRAATQATAWAVDEAILLLLLAAAFVGILPTLTLYKIDGDAYAVGSFAADALAGLPLNGAEPLFGTNLGPGVRMVFNQSLPMFYLWSYLSGIDPLKLTAVAARPMLALWSLLAIYALGKAAGSAETANGRRLGLFTASIQLLIYLASPFLRGDNVSLFFFERTTADKFMVPATMLPVVFAFAIYFLRAGQSSAWLAAALATFAVSTIHPLIAAMLALALAAFGGFHLLLKLGGHGQKPAILRSAGLGTLAAVAMFLPLAQLALARGEAPLAPSYPESLEGWPVAYKSVPALPFAHLSTLSIAGPLPDLSQVEAGEADTTLNPFLIWRFAVNMNRRRLILTSLDRYISDPNIILEPPYLLALLLLPFLLFKIRSNLGAQFAVSVSLAILFVMFNPLVTPIIGSLVMPWILWRFVWMLPSALSIALAFSRLSSVVNRAWKATARPKVFRLARIPSELAIIAIAGLLLSPAVARNLRELNHRAGFPYFYPAPERLFARLDAATRVKGGPLGAATVLADQDLSVTIPAYVANAHIVAHRAPTTSEIFPADRQAEALQRLIDQNAFFRSRYLTADALEILRRYDVGYVIAPGGSNLDIQLRLAAPWFEWLLDDQSYSLYAVRQLPPLTQAIEGNSALGRRQWSDAEELYRAELEQSPDNLLALFGLAEIAHARGRFEDALLLLQAAIARSDLAVLHYRLGQLYTELGQSERSIAEFDRAQQAAPHIARFHVAMGDACLSAGREECAAEQYAIAVTRQNLPDEAAQRIALGDLWRQRSRDRALTYYEQAVAHKPSLANQLLLVNAYQEAGQFTQAEALLQVLQIQHPLSTEALIVAADVQAAQASYDQAVTLYRRAIQRQDFLGQESVDTHLALAQTLLNANRLEESNVEIAHILALQPSNAAAYRLQGDLYQAQQRTDEATLAYQQAFRLDPTQVGLYLALSNQFRQQGGRQDEVLSLLLSAIRANPDEATLALALGEQLQRRGDTQAAIDAYLSALDMFELDTLSNNLNPRITDISRAYAYTRLAGVSEDGGQLEPAMNYYSAAVAAAPDLPWPQMMWGDALRRRNNGSGAEAAYRRAIQNDPTFVNAYIHLADLLDAQGKVAEAGSFRQQAVQLALTQSSRQQTSRNHPGLGKIIPTSAVGPRQLEIALGSDETSPEGARVANNARFQEIQIPGDPLAGTWNLEAGDWSEYSNALSLLARLYQTSGQSKEAVELYKQSIARAQGEGAYPIIRAQYYKGLGDLYLSQNQPELAAEAYSNAVALDDWWPQARLGLARALTELDQAEEALNQLRSAVEMAPGYVEAQVSLADALAQQGASNQALQIYATTAEAHAGNARATLALAHAWQDHQQWAKAEQSFRDTLAINPGNADAYVGLAALLIEQARYDEARPLLEQAVEADFQNVNAYLQSAILEQRQGNPARALDWFRRAGALPANGQIASIVLIDLLQRFANYDASLTYVREALKQQPEDVDLLLRLARLQRTLGQYSEGMATLLNAARLNLTDGRLSAELGELYLTQGRPQAALAAYRQTINLEPEGVAYYLKIAELWRAQAAADQALAVLKNGLERAVRPAPLIAAMAALYSQQGNSAAAKAALDQALERFGEETELVLAMGAYFESQNARKTTDAPRGLPKAEAWYWEILARQPQNAALHVALGDYYLRQNRTEEAFAHFERAVALEPTRASHYLALGDAYKLAERKSEAASAYLQAIVLEPTLVDGYASLADLYQSQQQWDEAQAVYERGLAVAPTDGLLYVQYGAFFLARGEKEAALEWLRRADQVAPTTATLIARSKIYSEMRRMDDAKQDLNAALRKEPGSIDALVSLGDLYRDIGDVSSAQRTYQEVSKLMPGVAAGQLRLERLRR